jgi:hypothetical protein
LRQAPGHSSGFLAMAGRALVHERAKLVPVTPRRVSTAEQCSRWRTGPTRPGRSLTGGSDAQCSRYPPGRNGGPATFSPAAEVAFLKDDKVPGCRAILITTLERQEVERVISQ